VLPSNLLVVRRRGKTIKPKFVSLSEDNVALAERVADLFTSNVGKKKGVLNDEYEALEEESPEDYRFLRGLYTLLERRIITRPVTPDIDPFLLRQTIYEMANELFGGSVVSSEDREKILNEASERLHVTRETLAEGMWADEDDELVIKEFDGISGEDLLHQYNLSLIQTLLFKASVLEASFDCDTLTLRNLLRGVRFYGLMYDVARNDDETFQLTVNGPISVLKMTKKYGTSLAKFLPLLLETEKWTLKANIKEVRKILEFKLTAEEFARFYGARERSVEEKPVFDSRVEERFYRGFTSLGSGWTLKREPEPIIKDSVVMFPDFSFEGFGQKVFMEIMGFWTDDYLKKKMKKLKTLTPEKFILCVDRKMQCSTRSLKGDVIYYDKKIPLKKVYEILKRYEKESVSRDLKSIKFEESALRTPVVTLKELSSTLNVSIESLREFMEKQTLKEHALTSNLLISKELMKKLAERLDEFVRQGRTYDESLTLISKHVPGEYCPEVFGKLGYAVEWNSLDMGSAPIKKQK